MELQSMKETEKENENEKTDGELTQQAGKERLENKENFVTKRNRYTCKDEPISNLGVIATGQVETKQQGQEVKVELNSNQTKTSILDATQPQVDKHATTNKIKLKQGICCQDRGFNVNVNENDNKSQTDATSQFGFGWTTTSFGGQHRLDFTFGGKAAVKIPDFSAQNTHRKSEKKQVIRGRRGIRN